MNNPLVSIVSLTYNHEKFIRRALESFIMQKTNFEYEIIIHDDASTDNTQQIIREYKKKYPEIIKPILQEENQKSKGSGIVTKTAYSAARGKYIALCEGDDYWTDPLKLQKQVEFLENNIEYVGCYHKAQLINEIDELRGTLPEHGDETDLTFDTLLNLRAAIRRYESTAYVAGHSFLFDGIHMYTVDSITDAWRVGIYNPKDLSKPLKIAIINPSPYRDYALRIGLNPVTNQLWIVGYTSVPISETTSRVTFRIEILEKDLNRIKSIWLENCSDARDVVFDEYGYAYIITYDRNFGENAILKFDMYGNLVKEALLDILPRKLAYWNGYIVVAGEKRVDGYVRHVVQLLDRELNILDELVLSMNVDADSFFGGEGRMIVDGNNLYVAGWDYAKGGNNPRWVMYSIGLGEYSSAPTTPSTYITTVTETVTAPTTKTVTYTVTIPVTHISTVTKTVTVTRTVATGSSGLPSSETMILSGAILLLGFVIAIVISRKR